jgi:phage shock protein E
MLDRPRRLTPAGTHPLSSTETERFSTGVPRPQRRPGLGLLLDVRSEPEFRSGAAEGALHVPLTARMHRVRELAPDLATPLQLYCASGARSALGCQLLRQLGYTEVTNLGGLREALALQGGAS